MARKSIQSAIAASGVKYLTPAEVSQRFAGRVAVGTLRNWRYLKRGPPFVRMGYRTVLYPLADLLKWEESTKVNYSERT